MTRPDGSVLTGMEPSVINPTSLGQVMRTFGFRLTDAPLGDYEIVMTIRDDIAGRSFEMREPFKVVEPLPASAMPPPLTAQPSAATPPPATPPPATPPNNAACCSAARPQTKPPGR